MAFVSSPVHYPPTSSPREQASPRKRRRIEVGHEREALQDVDCNILPLQHPKPANKLAGFVDEEDSDNESSLERLYRERMLSNVTNRVPTIDEVEHTLSTKNNQHDDRHDSGCEILSSPPSARERHTSIIALESSPFKVLHQARTCSGRSIPIRQRRKAAAIHYSAIVAERSTTMPGRAQKSYYGIDIHSLVDEGQAFLATRTTSVAPTEAVLPSVETSDGAGPAACRTHLWTEKYRPRKFTDLIGDERTHRSVLRWLKSWDPVVFPAQSLKPKARSFSARETPNDSVERPHRKILLLTGPAGLGKTTLAHVCARQAGYETHEINASDERTKEVVKGRIRDMVGTENVRSVDAGSTKKRAAKPVCVVVDEVDGVVSGNNASGGDGGFIKALLDLLAMDHRNATRRLETTGNGKRKGDNFRMLRPLILICNDVYHPSLRLLRHGPHAEVIHVRRPALAMVIPRLCSIFEREGVPADSDGVRTLCEAAWGVTSKRQGGKGNAGGGQGEGDIRCILVAGEWVAGKLRTAALASLPGTTRLTRRWIESNVVSEMAHGGGMAKSLGRGGSRDVVQRVFKHNAGFPATLSKAPGKRKNQDSYDQQAAIGVSEAVKRGAMEKLREMVETTGEDEKILLDCFQTYPTHPYQDTTTLTKPDLASDWLHFSSLCSHRLHHQQEWDLAPYLSFPILAFHNLFASANVSHAQASATTGAAAGSENIPPHPFSTVRADSHAHETTRANTATLSQLQSQLSLPIQRSFRSHSSVITELIPYTLRILNPSVKPTLVGGASSVRRGEERERVDRSVDTMRAIGVRFDKGRVDLRDSEAEGSIAPGTCLNGAMGRDNGGWVYRMDPPLDEVGSYPMLESKGLVGSWDGDAGKARYALRQVLASSHDVALKKADADARTRRSGLPSQGLADGSEDVEKSTAELEAARRKAKAAVKRDFFGRPIVATTASGDAVAADAGLGGVRRDGGDGKGDRPRVWATYHEGFSNAVRKPITTKELMEGL